MAYSQLPSLTTLERFPYGQACVYAPRVKLTKRQREPLRAAASADHGHVWPPRVLSLGRAQPDWEALKCAGYLEPVDGDRLRPLNINKDKFQALPPELQKAVAQAGKQTAAWSNEFAKQANERAYGQMRQAGMKIVEPQDRNAWAAAMRPLWEEMAKDTESQQLLKLITAVQ